MLGKCFTYVSAILHSTSIVLAECAGVFWAHNYQCGIYISWDVGYVSVVQLTEIETIAIGYV